MERAMKVTGKGKLYVKPDQIRLTMNLTAVKESYEEAMSLSSAQVKQLKDSFAGLGFQENALKTLSFRVDSKYENYRDGDEWKQRFVGYEFQHSLKLEFDSDNEMLGRVLSALAKSGVKPEFHIDYTVKDKEAVKLQLIGKAVEDSKAKAEVLAKAAGVQLKEISKMEYSWEPEDIIVRPMPKMLAANFSMDQDEACQMNINPEDIELTDSVTIVWGIE